MTTESYFSMNAQVDLLDYQTALPALRSDLADRGPCLAYTYLIDTIWFHDLFGPHLAHSLLMVLADNRQRVALRGLTQEFAKLAAATWSTNRTMHDKTLVFPQKNVVYLTTSNLTKGSWTLSLNSTARIHCPAFCHRLEEQFHAHWRTALPLPKTIKV
jgi:hypothetical protein